MTKLNRSINDEAKDKIVISSNACIYRNIENYFFTSIMSRASSEDLVNEVYSFFKKKNSYKILDITKTNNNEKNRLVNMRCVSRECFNSNLEKLIVIKDGKDISIVVNDEEHLKISSRIDGVGLDEAYKNARDIERILEKEFQFSFDDKFGFLMQDVKKAGVALEVVLTVHTPLLELASQTKMIKRRLKDINYTFTPAFGGRLRNMGGFYNISTIATLGKNEKNVILEMLDIADKIIDKEIMLRKEFIKDEREKAIDEISRSYGILTNATLMKHNEAELLVSYIKLGVDMKLIEIPRLAEVNFYDLMQNISNDNIKARNPRIKSELAIEKERAKYLRLELS